MSLDKRVLAQDLPQYQQSTKAARARENKKIEAENKAAEKQYQDDLKKYEQEKAAYDKQLAAYQSSAQGQHDTQTSQITAKIKALETQRKSELNDAYLAVYGPGGTGQQHQYTSAKNTINKNYDSAVNKLNQQQNVLTNYYNFSVAYPNQPIPNDVFKTFESSKSFSLVDLYERKKTGKEIKSEYQRQGSMLQAQSESLKLRESYALGGTGNVSGFGLSGGKERAGNIKTESQQTSNIVFPFVPSFAQNTREPLINVKTGERASDGSWRANNPVALVKSLDKKQVDEGVTILNKQSQRENILLPVTPEEIETSQEKTVWQVTIDGKVRSFNTEEKAQNFINRISPRQDTELLTFVNAETLNEKQIGPKRNEILFVGANAQGYTLQPNETTTPLKTGVRILDSPQTPLEELVEGVSRPITNFLSMSKDFGEALFKNDLTAPKPFTQRENIFGLPVPKTNTVLKETAGGELLSLRSPDLSKPGIIGSAISEGILLAVGLKTPRLLPKINTKPKIQSIERPNIEKKIYPRNQKPLSMDLVNKPIGKNTSFNSENISIGRGIADTNIAKPVKKVSFDPQYKPSKRANEIDFSDFGEKVGPTSKIGDKPIAAKQSDVKITSGKNPNVVKADPFYRPSKRANEIDLSSDNILTEFQSTKVGLGRGVSPEIPIKGKLPKPVQPDPYYKPSKRSNEIDFSDGKLVGFSSTKIKLGKAQARPTTANIKGKQITPVKSDYFYKPSKRANEIDFSDFGEKVGPTSKIGDKPTPGKQSDVKFGFKKKKKSDFIVNKINFEGQGMEIKSGSQSLIQIQKAELKTKQKLTRQKQTPVNINWTEKIETANLPKTGKAPVAQIIKPLEKQKKRKVYLQEQSYEQSYDIVLHKQRPTQKQVGITKTIQTPKIMTGEAFKFYTPQKIQPKTLSKQKQPQREKYLYETKVILNYFPKQAQKEAQVQKLASPLAPAQPTKLSQPAALKPIARQTYKFARPTPTKNKRVVGFYWPDKERKVPKSVKAKQKARDDFLGHSSETQIGGLFKRKEITYGDKKIDRLLQGDSRVVKGKKRTPTRTPKAKYDILGFKVKKGRKVKDDKFW